MPPPEDIGLEPSYPKSNDTTNPKSTAHACNPFLIRHVPHSRARSTEDAEVPYQTDDYRSI